LPRRVVLVAGQSFPFALTALEEAFLVEGGLTQLFKRYKTDLFRAAMQPKTSNKSTCGAPVEAW
ncbi:hypothetical protein DYB31_008374, partial [Aphanomyces astaci]